MNFFGVVAGIILICLCLQTCGRDDTDQPYKGGKRSGMMLFTDYKTGVQYVGNPFMGFTVRVGEDGKPYTGKP